MFGRKQAVARGPLALGFPNRAVWTEPTEVVKRLLYFEIVSERAGGYCAYCRQGDLFARGETLDAVHRNAIEAVQSRFLNEAADYSVAFVLK